MMTKKELDSTHQRTAELVWAINALSTNGDDARHKMCIPHQHIDVCVVEISKKSRILAYQLRDILNITGLSLRACGTGQFSEYIPFEVGKQAVSGVVVR